MIHDLLLFILDQCPAIDPKYERRGIILVIVIELWMDVLRRQWISLELGAEGHFYIIFRGVRLETLQDEEMIAAIHLATSFALD